MSIESLPDTWHTRDLPVLRAIVKQYDATTQTVPHQDIEAATGLEYADVQRACIALDRAGYHLPGWLKGTPGGRCLGGRPRHRSW